MGNQGNNPWRIYSNLDDPNLIPKKVRGVMKLICPRFLISSFRSHFYLVSLLSFTSPSIFHLFFFLAATVFPEMAAPSPFLPPVSSSSSSSQQGEHRHFWSQEGELYAAVDQKRFNFPLHAYHIWLRHFHFVLKRFLFATSNAVYVRNADKAEAGKSPHGFFLQHHHHHGQRHHHYGQQQQQQQHQQQQQKWPQSMLSAHHLLQEEQRLQLYHHQMYGAAAAYSMPPPPPPPLPPPPPPPSTSYTSNTECKGDEDNGESDQREREEGEAEEGEDGDNRLVCQSQSPKKITMSHCCESNLSD